jgi:predicted nucleotidyltransferase
MSIENSSVSSFEKKSQKELQKDLIVKEFLGDLYKPEKILAQKVEEIGIGGIKVTFIFPPYERTIQ